MKDNNNMDERETMRERVYELLEKNLPLADLDSDFLFEELSSLDITTVMMVLSEEYNITIDSHDATPKNFMSVDSLVDLVSKKTATSKA